jgi:hypothetical protein
MTPYQKQPTQTPISGRVLEHLTAVETTPPSFVSQRMRNMISGSLHHQDPDYQGTKEKLRFVV